MDEARRQYFKDTLFTHPKEKIPWNKQEEMCNDLTAVLDELDQEASLEDLHAIFSIPENTYDAETLKKAVSETISSGHILLALYGTLSGLGVEETNLRKIDVGDFWGYAEKFAHTRAVRSPAPLPRSIGKISNVEEINLNLDHDGRWGLQDGRESCASWRTLHRFLFTH